MDRRWLPQRGMGGACVRACLSAVACAAALAAAAAEAPAAIDVERYAFTGHTLLDGAQLEAAVAPFRGRRTLEELRRAAEAVQRLYAEAGYAGVVAYVPPQTGGGTVTIAIVEGKVTRIVVPGADVDGAAATRARLPDLVEGRTPMVRRIDAQLAIANENPARPLRLLLKPGAATGEIEAEIGTEDAPASGFQAWFDDTGNERTGRYRLGLGWQHADVSGIGDMFGVQASTSPTKPSQVKVLSASYRRPIPAWLLVTDVYAAYSDVDAGTSPTAVGDIRFNGRGNLAGVRATRHLLRSGSLDHRLGVALDWREYLNQCDIANLPPGACGPAEADVAVTPLTLDYSVRSAAGWPWSAGVAVMRNLGIGVRYSDDADFDAVRPGARPGYTALRLTGNLMVPITESWQLRLRAAAQWTDDALVTGEQFGVGGPHTVRGYEERELAGDSGVLVSMELGGPELLAGDAAGSRTHSLQPFVFVDGGRVENRLDAPCDGARSRCTAAGAGAGLVYTGRQAQGRIAVATALRDAVTTQKGDARVHLQLNVQF